MTLISVGTDPVFLGILTVYAGIVLAIGYYGFARTKDESDFLVAGREVGPVAGAATLAASQLSASTFLGAVGIHYTFGVGFIWIWAGLWTGWLVSLVFVAPQMRRFGGETVPDFVAMRYGDDGAGGDYTRTLTAGLLVVVQTVFLTAQVTAGGLILQTLLGVPQTIGMVLMVVVAVLYTMIGGMRASVLTDLLQAIVMLLGILIAVPLTLGYVGGISGLNALLASYRPSLVGQAFSTIDMVGFMAASAFGIVAGPFEITRIYSLRDEATVRQAISISLAFQAIVAVTVAILGLAMRALFPTLPTPDLAGVVLAINVLGPVLGALLIAAVFSALLSTMDSVMLVSSAAIAHDMYLTLVNPQAGENLRVWVNRGAVVLVGTVPIGFALNRELLGGLITLISLLQLSLLGGMLFAPLVLGLHWRGATTPGGVAGMVTGFTTVVLWHVGTEVIPVVPAALTAVVGDPVIPGVVTSTVALVAVSVTTEKPSRAALDPFFD